MPFEWLATTCLSIKVHTHHSHSHGLRLRADEVAAAHCYHLYRSQKPGGEMAVDPVTVTVQCGIMTNHSPSHCHGPAELWHALYDAMASESLSWTEARRTAHGRVIPGPALAT